MRPGVRFPREAGALAAIGLLAVALGAAVRLRDFLFARSLWLDEAMLTLNVAARTFAELRAPLDYGQVAPVPFLWLQKAGVALLGTAEPAFRLFPMAAGLVLPVLLWRVAAARLGAEAGVAAAVLAAGSPALVRYANEAKPYGVDALATVVLLGAAWAARRSPTRRRQCAVLLAGLAAVLVSFPAIFVAGAVVAWALADTEARRAGRVWLACGAAWGAASAAAYLAWYGARAGSTHQQQGYEHAFLVQGTLTVDKVRLAWRGTVLPVFLGNGSAIPAVPDAVAALLTAALAAGLLAAVRRQGRAVALLLAGPILLAAAASALRRYPLGVPRMMVFAAPLLVLLAASAIGAAAAAAGRRRPALGAAVVVLLAAGPLGVRLAGWPTPFAGEDARALVAAFRERPRRQEPVYVNARGAAAWVFYTTNWSRPDRERLDFYAGAAAGRAFENAAPRLFPVTSEADDLVYDYRGRREILGLPTGRQWRWPSYVQRGPDPGWAANEARRVAAAANPCAWLFFTRMSENAWKPLWWELRERGGRIESQRHAPGGLLARVCLPYKPEDLARLERWAADQPAAE